MVMTSGLPPRTVDDFISPTHDTLEAAGELKAPSLHPSTRVFMRRAARYGGLTDRVSVGYARRRLQTMMPLVATKPAVASVVDRTVAGPHGAIPIRIVTPRGDAALRPALVWFPGGGFVLGDLVTAEPTARSLANRLGAVVICADYRKAPEHQLDDGYDDALAVVHWTFANAEALSLDPTRICVGGDSAGGNLATVVAREYSATDGPVPLALQLLVYPAVSTESEPARSRNAADSFLDLAAMRWFETQLAGATDPGSPRHSPLSATDLSGLPAAIIVTAGYDPLRDEAIAYLDRLREAGVRAEHLHYADDIHGFFPMDLVLDNAVHAMDAITELAVDILQLDQPAGPLVPRSTVQLLRRTLARHLGEARTLADYTTERIRHSQIRAQRWVLRASGLPSGRDVQALSNQVKRLEHEIRTLRRQQHDADGPR